MTSYPTCTATGSTLLDTDGPFLSVPALKTAWPTGMPAPDRTALDALHDAKPAFEKAWDAWDMADEDDAAALEAYRTARDEWVDIILRTVLGWKDFYLTPASADVKVHSPDYSVTVIPTGRAQPWRHDRCPRPRHRPGRIPPRTP